MPMTMGLFRGLYLQMGDIRGPVKLIRLSYRDQIPRASSNQVTGMRDVTRVYAAGVPGLSEKESRERFEQSS